MTDTILGRLTGLELLQELDKRYPEAQNYVYTAGAAYPAAQRCQIVDHIEKAMKRAEKNHYVTSEARNLAETLTKDLTADLKKDPEKAPQKIQKIEDFVAAAVANPVPHRAHIQACLAAIKDPRRNSPILEAPNTMKNDILLSKVTGLELLEELDGRYNDAFQYVYFTTDYPIAKRREIVDRIEGVMKQVKEGANVLDGATKLKGFLIHYLWNDLKAKPTETAKRMKNLEDFAAIFAAQPSPHKEHMETVLGGIVHEDRGHILDKGPYGGDPLNFVFDFCDYNGR